MLVFTKSKSANIFDDTEYQNALHFAEALSSSKRLDILKLLSTRQMTITEISKELSIPTSTVIFHLKILEKATLIRQNIVPGSKKQTLTAGILTHAVNFHFENTRPISQGETKMLVFEMPIGNYHRIQSASSVGAYSYTGSTDLSLKSPYHTDRFFAEQIRMGKSAYVNYRFPSHFDDELLELNFSLEICAESPNHNNDFLSDITFWINDIEITTFTSPADFGGRKGIYSPDWVPEHVTQYGQLKTLAINHKGAYLDGMLVSSKINISNINLDQHPYLVFAVSNKKDAINNGGINLFGKHFGDFNQAIIMKAIVRN